MNLKNKRTMVLGSGISGIAASRLLYKLGAAVFLFDSDSRLTAEQVRAKLPDDMLVEVIVGELPFAVLDTLDLCILSPGVPTDLPIVLEMKDRNIPVWGEIELAYQSSKGRIAAITGTNGKTTTTALTGEIMKTWYDPVYVVGNIGNPYTDIALVTTKESIVVAELSSFQLETVKDFTPSVSAILNITPDHLNRHHTMEAYIEAKTNITKNQGENEVCVLNYEDETLRRIGETLKCPVFYFSSRQELETGIYLDGEQNIIYSSGGEKIKICNVKELKLLGLHSYENVMAASAIGIHMGVPLSMVKQAILSFEAVEHRIEYVARKKGVNYYNDSKGTNPDAAIKGIEAMETPTYLIGGGYDKDSEYEEWIKAFGSKVKLLVLIGQTREKIADAAKRCGFHSFVFADSLEEAVNICAQEARPGESVLLSPACASWGMFKNYEERGNVFKELVYKMED